jgi:hypothetical protein
MSEDQVNEFIGLCPICSGHLTLSEPHLTCLINPDHFCIRKNVFDEAWSSYSEGMRVAVLQTQKTILGDALLTTLLDFNLAVDKPTMNGKWTVENA